MPRRDQEIFCLVEGHVNVDCTHSKNKPGCWKWREGGEETRVEKYLHVNKMLSGFNCVPHHGEGEERRTWGKGCWRKKEIRGVAESEARRFTRSRGPGPATATPPIWTYQRRITPSLTSHPTPPSVPCQHSSLSEHKRSYILNPWSSSVRGALMNVLQRIKHTENVGHISPASAMDSPGHVIVPARNHLA